MGAAATRAARIRHIATQPTGQALLLSATSGVAQMVTAAVSLLVAREYAPQVFGTVTTIMSVGVVIVGIIDFGSNEYWVREFARTPKLASDMFARLYSKMVLSVLVASPFFFLPLLDAQSNWWSLGLTIIFMQFEQSMQVAPRGAKRAPLVAFSMLVERVCALVCVLVLGHLGMGPERLVVAFALGNLIGGLLLWPVSCRLIGNNRPMTLCNPWWGSFHYGLFSVSTSVQSMDVPLMRIVGGGAVAGLYGAVNRWTAPLQLLIGSFTQASIPFVAGGASLKDGWAVLRKGAVLLGGSLLMMIGLVLFAGPLTSLLLGSRYAGSAEVLRLLALATGVVVVNQPLAMVLQATRRDREAAYSIMAGVVVQLGLILLLAGHIGANGAAVAAIGGQLMMLVLLAVSVRRAVRAERAPRRAS